MTASLILHVAAITPQALTDVLLAPFTVLGSTATFGSGALGAAALVTGRTRDLSTYVNYGLAVGFMVGAPLALPVLVAGLV
jgi:hypothetical protein